jgi:hypothetical protein
MQRVNKMARPSKLTPEITKRLTIYGDSEGCRMELEYARSIGKVVRVHGGDMGKAKG